MKPLGKKAKSWADRISSAAWFVSEESRCL